jgi:hypothetical protein
LGKNLPKLRVDIISKRRYEPQFFSQNFSVPKKKLPSKLEMFNIFKQTIATVLNSSEKFDLDIERKYETKLGHNLFWNSFKIDNANGRLWNRITSRQVIPFFTHFDLGAWIESSLDQTERIKFKFKKEYKFAPKQEIDCTSKLNNSQLFNNWKFVARMIRIGSLLKAAGNHICCANESYRRITESILIILAHSKIIKYKLVFDTFKKAIKLCNKNLDKWIL